MNRGNKVWIDVQPFRGGWQTTVRYRASLWISKFFKTEEEAKQWGDLVEYQIMTTPIVSLIDAVRDNITMILDPPTRSYFR